MINNGFFVENSLKNEEKKTVIILGRTRGGTSFASRVMYDLGLPTGSLLNT